MSNLRHAGENPEPERYAQNVHVLSCATAAPQAAGGPNSSTAWSETDVSTIQALCSASYPGTTTIAFLETPPAATSQANRDFLSQAFALPSSFWTELYQEANSYLGYNETSGQDDKIQRFDTDFRFLCKCTRQKPGSKAPSKNQSGLSYVWEKMSFYTSWQQEGTFIMLCFDLSDALREGIIARAKLINVSSYCSAFIGLDLAVEAMVEDYEGAVWEWRDEVRKIEKQREELEKIDQVATKATYERIHELSRHTTHCSENLTSAIETVSIMLETIREMTSTVAGRDCSALDRKIRAGLVRHHSMLKSLLNRSKAVESRLSSETSLIFHINTQQVAKLAREDSAISKTIALLGLLFLPGTLVSAIFSTSFFNFTPATDETPARWSVSEKFWIYWAVTGSITVITITGWILWQWPIIKNYVDDYRKRWKDRKRREPRERVENTLLPVTQSTKG